MSKPFCLRLLIAAAVLSHTSLAWGQIARIEIHPFESMTLTDEEFLAGKKDGKSVIVAGELRIPRSETARLPAIVLLHASGGVSGAVADWSQFLNGLGVATFTLDSFTGRGIVSTINDQDRLGRLTMIIDAYRALDLLVKHARIDPAKVAVMGFSRGGQAALYSSLHRFQRSYASAGSEFAGYLVFYGDCSTRFRGDDDVSDKPIRLLHGAADEWVSVAPCRSLVQRLRAKGKDISLTEFAAAGHVFDSAGLAKAVRLANAQVVSRCKTEEAANGKVINVETGQAFSYKDACVDVGTTVVYNAEAHKASQRAVQEFVKSTLGAK
jgi:dienelactone hydrolase